MLRSHGSPPGCERDLRRDGEGMSLDPRFPGSLRRPRLRRPPLFSGISMETIGNPWLWAGFGGLVVIALLVDLVLMRHGGAHKVTFKEAMPGGAWAGSRWRWPSTAACGGTSGRPPDCGARPTAWALEFLTGYLVEKALAVDNIFVFLMLFTYFAVPEDAAPARAGDRHPRRHRPARDPDLRGRRCCWRSSTGCSTCSAPSCC